MKRFLLFITAMVLGMLHPLSTSAAQAAANHQKAEEQAPSIYAVTAAPTVGISKFTADSDPLSLTEVFSDNEVGYITERVVAAYGNGKLFFYQPRINNYNEVWKLRFEATSSTATLGLLTMQWNWHQVIFFHISLIMTHRHLRSMV